MKNKITTGLLLLTIIAGGWSSVAAARNIDQQPQPYPIEAVNVDPYNITILTPNGGEEFIAGEHMKIVWDRNVIWPEHDPMPLPITNDDQPIDAQEPTTRVNETEEYHQNTPRIAIDLIQNNVQGGYTTVHHIDTVSAHTNSYVWNIPNWVKNGDDYRIKVTLLEDIIYSQPMPCSNPSQGENDVACMMQEAAEYTGYSVSDTSDQPFTIIGSGDHIDQKVLAKIRDQIKILERNIEEQQQQIQILTQLINSL